MLRIIIAVVVFTFALPNVAFCDDGAATPSDGEIATQASATIKVCLDFVDAKVEEENVARQKNAENDTAETVAPDATKGEQKTTPEAFLETAAKNKPHYSSENCIGIVAEDCMADEGGYGTLGMAECYGRESEAWDVRLSQLPRTDLREFENAGRASAGETFTNYADGVDCLARCYV